MSALAEKMVTLAVLPMQTRMEPTVDEDEDDRPVTTRHESFGVKLAHQFPWLGSSNVAVGLALRRRFLSDPDAPSTAVRRKQIVGVSKFVYTPFLG